MSAFNGISKLIKSPFLIIISATLSIYFGIYFPDLSKKFSYIGHFYIDFLQFGILPLVITSISLSVYQLVLSKKHISMKRVMCGYLIFLIGTSVLGILLSSYWSLGSDISAKPEIQHLIEQGNFSNILMVSKNEPIIKQTKVSLGNFFLNVIPSNVFEALSKGSIIQILAISFLVGIAASFMNLNDKSLFISFLEIFNHLFKIIVNWAILLLPFGIFFFLADRVSSLTVSTILSMTQFVVIIFISLLFLIIVGLAIIGKKSRTSYILLIKTLKEPMLIALTTGSGFASMPSLMSSMIDGLKLNETSVTLLTPINIATCRFGNIFYYSFVAIFIAQLYNTPLIANEWLVIVIGAILAGLAATSTGIVNLGLLAMIMDPLGLPLGVVIILFIAIDPLIDPLRSLCTMVLDCAVVTFSIKPNSDG
jgi:Na+/H+-dicarboxylate symporter